MAYHRVKPYTADNTDSGTIVAEQPAKAEDGGSDRGETLSALQPQDSDPTAPQMSVRVNGKFAPGHSGNPGGSTKQDSLAAQVRAILREPVSKADKRTNMQAILDTAVKQAKNGDTRARDFLANRGFGQAEQRIKQDVTKTDVIVLE